MTIFHNQLRNKMQKYFVLLALIPLFGGISIAQSTSEEEIKIKALLFLLICKMFPSTSMPSWPTLIFPTTLLLPGRLVLKPGPGRNTVSATAINIAPTGQPPPLPWIIKKVLAKPLAVTSTMIWWRQGFGRASG